MQEPESDISKSQCKRDAEALRNLGQELTQLTGEQLRRLPLPEDLLQAVLLAQSIKQHGGRKRQLQYIGKLLRNVDAKPIQHALSVMTRPSIEATAQLHALERWRDRLIAEGDDAIPDILHQFPNADRQRLRQMIRGARSDARTEQAPRAARALFQYLKQLQAQD